MMLFPAVLMNFPNSEVCLIGEWSISREKKHSFIYKIFLFKHESIACVTDLATGI